MTEKIRTQGYKEPADPLLKKAKNHSAVAQKIKFNKENVSKTSAIVPVPEQEDIITLRYEKSDEFKELASDFEKDNDVVLVINNDEDDIIVDVPIDQSADFIEFMADNGIKEKEDSEKSMVDAKSAENAADDAKSTKDAVDHVKSVDSSAELKTEDKIIAEAQSKRSKRAVSKDKTRTAKKVGDKGIAGDLISWLKNPGKIDLQGVDTADAE